MNGSTRLRDAYTQAPPRCGYCHNSDHVSTGCPDVTPEEVEHYNQMDAADLASTHTLDPVVRCCMCGTPVHDRRQSFRARDTHETICNECGRAE